MKKILKQRIRIKQNQKKNRIEILIKTPGQKESTYTWTGYIPIKKIINYHQKKINKTATRKDYYKIRKHWQTKTPNYKEYQKGYKLNQIITKGKTTITTEKANNKGPITIQRQNKKLLEPLVQDKLLLKILGQEENQKKLKTGLEHTIKLKGKNNTGKTVTLAQLQTTNKTLKEVITKLKKIPTRIQVMDYSPTIKKIMGKKYEYKHKDNGNYTHVDVTTTYRKGR